jgi:tetratricopeptide (TPR) repeat protein
VILKDLFGERHPNTASCFNNVGDTYAKLGEHKLALEYQEKALAILKDLFGERHPDTLQVVCEIVIALNNRGQRYPAYLLLNQFLPILPRDHAYYHRLGRLEQQLLSKPLRPGFRNPPPGYKGK